MYQDGNASGTFSALESLDFLLEIQRRLWWSCQFHTLMETDKGCQLIRQPFHLLCIKSTPCFLKKPDVRNPHRKKQNFPIENMFYVVHTSWFCINVQCNVHISLPNPCPMTFLRLYCSSLQNSPSGWIMQCTPVCGTFQNHLTKMGWSSHGVHVMGWKVREDIVNFCWEK